MGWEVIGDFDLPEGGGTGGSGSSGVPLVDWSSPAGWVNYGPGFAEITWTTDAPTYPDGLVTVSSDGSLVSTTEGYVVDGSIGVSFPGYFLDSFHKDNDAVRVGGSVFGEADATVQFAFATTDEPGALWDTLTMTVVEAGQWNTVPSVDVIVVGQPEAIVYPLALSAGEMGVRLIAASFGAGVGVELDGSGRVLASEVGSGGSGLALPAQHPFANNATLAEDTAALAAYIPAYGHVQFETDQDTGDYKTYSGDQTMLKWLDAADNEIEERWPPEPGDRVVAKGQAGTWLVEQVVEGTPPVADQGVDVQLQNFADGAPFFDYVGLFFGVNKPDEARPPNPGAARDYRFTLPTGQFRYAWTHIVVVPPQNSDLDDHLFTTRLWRVAAGSPPTDPNTLAGTYNIITRWARLG